MRIRLFLALVSVSSAAVGIGVQACGGTSEVTVVQDSGAPDSTLDAPKDTAEVDATPQCDKTRDFLADIPDASLADGASTTSRCVVCVKAKCGTEIGNCAADCPCQDVSGKALECYAKTQDPLACGGKFLSVPPKTRTIGVALFSCVLQKCGDECAASSFLDAGDGGG